MREYVDRIKNKQKNYELDITKISGEVKIYSEICLTIKKEYKNFKVDILRKESGINKELQNMGKNMEKELRDMGKNMEKELQNMRKELRNMDNDHSDILIKYEVGLNNFKLSEENSKIYVEQVQELGIKVRGMAAYFELRNINITPQTNNIPIDIMDIESTVSIFLTAEQMNNMDRVKSPKVEKKDESEEKKNMGKIKRIIFYGKE